MIGRVGQGALRASNDADVSMALPKIPYGGFSPVRLPGRSIRQGLPVRRLLASDGLPLSFVLPASLVGSPFCAGGRCALEHLRSSGRCRSRGFAPDRVVLSRSILTCGPIRPTRRHIPISPLSGLYEMPSLCTLRLADLRGVPRFRCPSFLTCRPLRLRGDRKPVGSSRAVPTEAFAML